MKTWLMTLTCSLALLGATAHATGAAGTVAEKGKMLVAADGARLGNVYRVGPDGAAQIILEGKLVTVPAASLASVDGKLTTHLSKNEVLALR